MDKKNIVLIGMPGAGKSTVGVLVAKVTGLPFLDTDLLIQYREGRLLQDIINDVGVERFLVIEEAEIMALQADGAVIATGGSVVYSPAAMSRLKQMGPVVYLRLSYEEIEARINNITSRGIAMGEGKNLRDLYRERVPLYEKYADITIDCAGKGMEEVVTEIKERLYKPQK